MKTSHLLQTNTNTKNKLIHLLTNTSRETNKAPTEEQKKKHPNWIIVVIQNNPQTHIFLRSQIQKNEITGQNNPETLFFFFFARSQFTKMNRPPPFSLLIDIVLEKKEVINKTKLM
jgi:hypothetical protein